MKSSDVWTPAIVETAEQLSPSVRGLVVRPLGGVRPWTAGSHLRVRLAIAGRDEVRHYSLIGLPQHSLAEGHYRIAVKRAEPSHGGSRAMWALAPGDALSIAGPDNHFELPMAGPHATRPTLLVAGGIGITPLVGMALALAARGAPVSMAYAASSRDELVFAEPIAAALGERLQTFASDAGQRLDVATLVAALPPDAQMLVCGPVRLLQAAQRVWADAGRPAPDLRFETFGTGGQRPAEPFWVSVPRQGVRVEVPADRSLLDVLAENGVEALYDCRRGECGLCAMDVVELHGEIDHRDVFLSEHEKRAASKLCVCVSRICGGGVVLDSAWRPDT